jgi:type IV pilus assembly protein PilA
MQSTMLSRLLRVARDAVARRNTEADEEGTESGFTLIELMVVLLIMAILLAIAIPTFLGVKGGAQDRAAQSNLTNALISAKATYTQTGSYPATAAFIATMSTQEPELTFQTASVTASGNTVSFAVSSDFQQIIMTGYSPNNGGTCWALSDNNDPTGTAAIMGAAPSGDSYADWKAGATAATACSGTAAGGNPATNTPFWLSAYPTGLETAP